MFKALLNLFGERKPRPNEERRSSVTGYPDRINIDTYHKAHLVEWHDAATNVTRLPPDATKEEIGKAVRLHLELTRYNVKVDASIDTYSERLHQYLAAYGFETLEQLHKGAVRVEVYELEGNIKLVPTLNGGSRGRDRGFHEKDWRTVKCRLTDSDEKIGAKVRKALALSEE